MAGAERASVRSVTAPLLRFIALLGSVLPSFEIYLEVANLLGLNNESEVIWDSGHSDRLLNGRYRHYLHFPRNRVLGPSIQYS